MRHQVTGSLSISTDGIAAAVVEALLPHLADRNTPIIPFDAEQTRHALSNAFGQMSATRNVPESDYQLASELTAILHRLGYVLSEAPRTLTPPADRNRPDWFSRTDELRTS